MDVTRDGDDKIKRWKRAALEVENLKSRLNKAECESSNAETDLAKWLLPDDAMTHERFCVWYGDSLLAARTEHGQCFVSLRTRGKSWDTL